MASPSSKLTIAHTEASEGWGGQEIRVMVELTEMAKRGHRTILIAPPSSDIFRRGLDAQIETLPLSMRRQDFFANLKWLSGFLRSEKVHVVNTHSSRDSWLAGCAARRAGTPLVIKTRHISAPISRGWLTRLAYQKLHDFIITTSEGIARDMARFNGFDPRRIVAVPTGVDLGRFDCSGGGRRLREELGLPPKALLVGMVSVLRSWKGHPDFLKAARAVKAQAPSAYFVIVGEGPRRAHVEEDLLRMGLEDYVFLIGHRDEVPQVLCDLDVFVLPSYANEGVPQALLQALAMRRPVVATAVGGIPEVIASGVHGLLCGPNEPDALAENILRVLTDPPLARSLAERGRERVLEHYSLTQMINHLEQIYTERLGG
ncbi:MAG: glycosyltransferase family 4 protein [Verrucomicrobiae bacterium]|nr:glycosyltransferase family 4 protein [Verrucomicrobiae bacterium]